MNAVIQQRKAAVTRGPCTMINCPGAGNRPESAPARVRGCLALSLVLSIVAAAPAQAGDEAIDSVMYANPPIPVPRRVKVFSPALLPLWLRALERPEADVQRLAAATIAQAQARGMPGLEAAVGPLRKALAQPDLHPTVRLAVAQALVALDARQAADRLLALAKAGGPRLRNLIEPALARWDYAPARAFWLEQLQDSPTNEAAPSVRSRVLAMRGLGAVREPRAVPKLRAWALATLADPVLRLEAARALGVVQTAGSEADAARLTEGSGEGTPRLVAALLLRHHQSAEAVQILERLAFDAEPAVAACALERLVEIEPGRVAAQVRRVVANPDAEVRRRGIEALRKVPSPKHVPLLADLLDDPHPQVRALARKTLQQWAGAADYDAVVRREATRMLATAHWRALEQAAILLASLDHKPAAPRLVELLRFDRPEVFVAAAWGLRKLALPETLPELARVVAWQLPRFEDPANKERFEMIDMQVAQLAQALGAGRYRPAEPLLRRFVPKNFRIGQEARAAAIWALGLIHEGRPDPTLTQALLERLAPPPPTERPEDPRVQRMAAIAIGRMKDRQAEAALRRAYPGSLTEDVATNACGWALSQITGQALPPPGTVAIRQRGWFLEPNE